MKGLILAAGEGSRLRPLTLVRPKPLTPIAGKPLLGHNLDNLYDAGIEEIGVVVNPQCTQIREAFADYPVPLTFIEQATLSGTAHALYQAKDFIGDDPFALVFGDNLTNVSISQLIDTYRKGDIRSVLGVFDGGDPSKHAVIQVEGDRIIDIEERPKHPKSTLTSAGMFVLEPIIFEAIEHTAVSESGEYYLPDALELLVRSYPLGYTIIQGWRININQPSDVLKGLHLLLNDSSNGVHDRMGEIPPGVRCGSNVWVGNNCRIGEGTCLENTLVMDNVTIGKACTIMNTICGEGSRVRDGSVVSTDNGEPAIVGYGESI